MTYNHEIHHRQSIRLKDYDYSQAGAYFVTICSWNKECLFGAIKDGEMLVNEFGNIAMKCWEAIPNHFMNAGCDEFVVMPNHIHGIITINNCRGEVSSSLLEIVASNSKTKTAPIKGGETPLQKITLGKIVAYFKYQSAKQINQIRNTPGTPIWQRNYYEHIIRDDRELQTIREYIRYNPLKWYEDEENPEMKGIYKKMPNGYAIVSRLVQPEASPVSPGATVMFTSDDSDTPCTMMESNGRAYTHINGRAR